MCIRDRPDEVRTFEKGKFETVKIGSMTIGRASYESGWKWSEHVGAATGAALCEVEHVGLVVSGCAACRLQDGRYYEMRAGDLFYLSLIHISEPTRLLSISYAVFCLKKK